jgi:hypothetical protein
MLATNKVKVLYDCHEVLCCDWSQPNFVVSGGTDNDMKIFGCSDKVANL